MCVHMRIHQPGESPLLSGCFKCRGAGFQSAGRDYCPRAAAMGGSGRPGCPRQRKAVTWPGQQGPAGLLPAHAPTRGRMIPAPAPRPSCGRLGLPAAQSPGWHGGTLVAGGFLVWFAPWASSAGMMAKWAWQRASMRRFLAWRYDYEPPDMAQKGGTKRFK